MNRQRPINLDLRHLKHPIVSIASIFHRISGVVLFLLLPIMLYVLQLSLQSAETFDALQALLKLSYYKIVLWAFGTALGYHLIAGIRHLLMDMGHYEQLVSARRGAVLVITLSVFWSIILGVWIC